MKVTLRPVIIEPRNIEVVLTVSGSQVNKPIIHFELIQV